MPTKDDKIGALWLKSGPKGEYFTGEIELAGVKQSIVVFANGYKQLAKHPDWEIFKLRPRDAE